MILPPVSIPLLPELDEAIHSLLTAHAAACEEPMAMAVALTRYDRVDRLQVVPVACEREVVGNRIVLRLESALACSIAEDVVEEARA